MRIFATQNRMSSTLFGYKSIMPVKRSVKPYSAYKTGKKYTKEHYGGGTGNGVAASLDADRGKIYAYNVKHSIRASHYDRRAKSRKAIRPLLGEQSGVSGGRRASGYRTGYQKRKKLGGYPYFCGGGGDSLGYKAWQSRCVQHIYGYHKGYKCRKNADSSFQSVARPLDKALEVGFPSEYHKERGEAYYKRNGKRGDIFDHAISSVAFCDRSFA